MVAFSDRIKTLQPSAIREILKFTAYPDVISFAGGNPAPEAFPVDKIKEIMNDIMDTDPITALQYSVSEGYTPLRDALKEDLAEKGIFKWNEDELIITAGAQQVMEMTAKVLCNEGETIICEEPSFIGSLNSFRSYNSKLVGVPMDDEGIDPNLLEQALKDNPRTAFIYLIPNFQNPTGRTMSLERRKQVLELAYKYKTHIIEDNPYGDLRFNGDDVASIRSMDTQGRVIYAGTFSKTVAPGLRVGFMCAEKSIIAKATVALQVSTVHTSILSQMIVHRFITKYDFKEHLKNLQQIYGKKCDLMLTNLKLKMPKSITFTEPDGGLFIWGTLPDGDLDYFVKKAIDQKVAIVTGRAFLVDERKPTLSFRLNYSTPTDEQILKGVDILAETAKTMYK